MAAASGLPSIEGARLAVDEINAAGGVVIGGKTYRVRLLERDYDNRPDAAASLARELINLDSADALVGPQVSAHALTAASVAEMAGVPMITPMASNPGVTRGRRFVFRLAFLDDFQGGLLAQYAADSMKLRRIGVLYDAASPYGHDIAALFGSTFESHGGRMVASETFVSDGGDDFRPQLRRILAASPDGILLPNYASQDSFQVRQARALGFKGRFLGSDSWDPVSLGKIPEAVGAVLVSNWDHRIPRGPSRDFVARFEARYQHRPRTSAAATSDAIHLLVDAARRAGSLDGAEWAKAIGATSEFVGAASVYRFHGTGDPHRGGALLFVGFGHDSLLAVVEPPR
jgi:branched-chain amino acid transport system substrate-binding protein